MSRTSDKARVPVRLREGWLLESLREAAEEAASLPAWAVAINRAHDQQYSIRGHMTDDAMQRARDAVKEIRALCNAPMMRDDAAYLVHVALNVIEVALGTRPARPLHRPGQ